MIKKKKKRTPGFGASQIFYVDIVEIAMCSILSPPIGVTSVVGSEDKVLLSNLQRHYTESLVHRFAQDLQLYVL